MNKTFSDIIIGVLIGVGITLFIGIVWIRVANNLEVENSLKEARRLADEGGLFRVYLEKAKAAAKKLNKDICARTKEIEAIAKKRDAEISVPGLLKEARRLADNGTPYFDRHLEWAKEEADKIGRDISAEMKEIESIGKKKVSENEVLEYLAKASKLAEEGSASFDVYLEVAESCAKKISKDISAEVNAIRESANKR